MSDERERVKLVGGYEAGKSKLIDKGSERLVLAPSPRLPRAIEGGNVVYRRLRLNAGEVRMSVFIPEGWTDAEGLFELVDGYLEAGGAHAADASPF